MSYESKIEAGLYYNKEHEWVKVEGETATVGISDYAQHLLTDVVFVELPKIGKQVNQFAPACVVESVKSVSDVYAPLSGTVNEVNSALEGAPETVNNDAFGEGWMFKLTGINTAELSNLMTAEQYSDFVHSQDH